MEIRDYTKEFDARVATGGTLALPDGVYGIRRTLHLPAGVSLQLAPGATLRALAPFDGDALVRKTTDAPHQWGGSIGGGTLDGAGLPILGIDVDYACRLDIRDLEIINTARGGIHIGTRGHYEVNVSHVRMSLDANLPHCPGSIGLHYEKCTDSLINGVVIIGYETGVRSDSSSNDFHQVHVWNFPGNGPLKYCFYCNGWNDSYQQCYADSPFDGDNAAYGFYVTRPFNRITNGRVYCNGFCPDGTVVGIYLADGGTHGTYLANHFTAQEGHRMAAAFAGTFEAACMLGNSFSPTVMDGLACRIPSGGGGLSRMPELTIAGMTPEVIA
jgi:hypothetical protein